MKAIAGDFVALSKKVYYKDIVYFKSKESWFYARKGLKIKVTWIVDTELNMEWEKRNNVSFISIINLTTKN